jgi:hypothetical protein
VEVRLDAPPGIAIEAPPVHITSDREIAWRILPSRAVTGDLQFTTGGVEVTKAIAASNRPIHSPVFLLRRRARSLWAFLVHPEESRLPPGAIEWLDVDYPGATRWWIVWFFGVSSASALLVTLVSPSSR